MQSTTIAVDTAKLVFEVVVSDGHRVIENHRLNRAEFQAFIVHQPPSRFVMEACGGSHHWARLMLAISKRGDKYVRTLLIHGTRTVLLGARRNENAGRPLSPLQQWALGVQAGRITTRPPAPWPTSWPESPGQAGLTAPALMRTIRPSRPDTLTFRFPTSGCAGEDSDHGEMGRPHRIWMPVTNPSEKLSCNVWHDPMRISMKARAERAHQQAEYTTATAPLSL